MWVLVFVFVTAPFGLVVFAVDCVDNEDGGRLWIVIVIIDYLWRPVS